MPTGKFIILNNSLLLNTLISCIITIIIIDGYKSILISKLKLKINKFD